VAIDSARHIAGRASGEITVATFDQLIATAGGAQP
jgi:hypothetical protein